MEDAPERKDDDFERTVINDAYARLARAVVVRACLDSVAIQHPRLMRRYIWNWRRSESTDENGKPVRLPHYPLWMEQQQAQIAGYLMDGGGDLAQATGVFDLVCKARKHKPNKQNNNRVFVYCRRNRKFRKLGL